MKRAVVALALLCATVAASAETASILPGADPFALSDGGRLYIYPTGRGATLDVWSQAAAGWHDDRVLLTLKAISWAGDDRVGKHFLWAPDMIAANGRYYFYYAVGPQDPTPSRLGVATCDGPEGPCTDSGKPLLTGGNGFEAIDPMVFIAPTGTRYLYAGGSAGARLRVFTLAPDMVTIEHEVAVDQPPAFTEGVFMHERNGIYYLSYSHGHWNRSDYSVHYAMAPTPTGPWKYRGVLLASEGKYKGPGHHSFVRDPATGDWLIVYHRWEGKRGDGPYEGDRRTVIQKIDYLPDGEIAPIHMVD
ncbi:family 43 glycosylhydrolase (plasmid) [Polymorphobacter sp. PAMC 29334]|uniref:family 43 glycosylhydrolase n=1 Tax=Polymorphobacter sp. PAMC 29334 TaxID=2862331 RepID=UPI001C795DD9|nr:family 43 glycosylhydrolase [Polymorphobacter sp. PAMC 29334]QYE33262.1 family 43 glycosylhydrolase [Polymorphobacter sp. PAMC 29334]